MVAQAAPTRVPGAPRHASLPAGTDISGFAGWAVDNWGGCGQLRFDQGLELAWASTRRTTASARRSGLPTLQVVEFSDYDQGWKWRGVAEFAAGRPLAWFDDEHDEHAGGEEFARQRHGTPTLLCHVDPAQGLGSAHLAAVREWAS
jgi:hypothetical protein